LPIDTGCLWSGTFHGLCNRLLRAHHRDAGLPQTFQILDTADQLAAIKRLLKANGLDDDKYPPRDVQRFINGAKEDGQRPADVQAYDSHQRRLVEIYQLYEAQCQREGVVDFAELLLRAYELLSRNAPVREHYQRRFRHILVDEFQDTNTLQYQWLKLLAGGAPPSLPWATTTNPSTHSVAPMSATWPTSSATTRAAPSSAWSRTIARTGISWIPPMRSSAITVAGSSRTSGRNREKASRCAWWSSPQTASRRSVSSTKCGHFSTKGACDANAPCCTAVAPNRACWSTRCSLPASRTRCMAGCAWSSVRKSSTHWPTCV